ncbi:hypothetical protein GCM10010249_41750 [Streptomyces roseolilacinus]|uniref:Uncharacterized protein n=1 Tax=Streptomyces roseolilacinus TaxID=66904 RepID=A0A918B4N1_9ACTN|nr:hypothetical protein GCM10010249_41750 [Streptomyces roseolilacinus]
MLAFGTLPLTFDSAPSPWAHPGGPRTAVPAASRDIALRDTTDGSCLPTREPVAAI